jgi:hypothetical protein
MNEAQVTHAHSIADHMHRYALPFLRQMNTFSYNDLSYLSAEQFEDRMVQEVHDLCKQLDQVIKDMMPISDHA